MDFDFYQSEYMMGDIPDEATFRPLALRAERQLQRYEQIYTVTAKGPKDRRMAVCAMADALYGFQQAMSGAAVSSSSVGSVSTSFKVPELDVSSKAQNKELYQCACLYLDIARGCGR